MKAVNCEGCPVPWSEFQSLASIAVNQWILTLITVTTTNISSRSMTKKNLQHLLPEKFKILSLLDRVNQNVLVVVRNCFKKIEIEKFKSKKTIHKPN